MSKDVSSFGRPVRHHAVRLSRPGQERDLRQGRPRLERYRQQQGTNRATLPLRWLPESMAFRYILASLPNPEDTVMVGSTGCTSLVFPWWPCKHSLSLRQPKRHRLRLEARLERPLPRPTKDVVVLAGDGATVDIGLDMTCKPGSVRRSSHDLFR